MFVLMLVLPMIGSVVVGIFGYRLGRKGSDVVVKFSSIVSIVCSLYGCYEVGIRQNIVYVEVKEWISLGILDSSLGMKVDAVSVVMSVLVTVITGLVVMYSSEYMKEDRSYIRYICYISLFSFFMLVVVMSSDFLCLFIGYEGVGIVSFLLISFWITSIEGSRSSIQAVLVNRIGDIILLIGIVVIFKVSGSVRFDVVFLVCEGSDVGRNKEYLLVGTVLVVIGCLSKSAQLGLHVWLPNAMAAPTPISALLHAATMVTAGIYVLIRISSLLEVNKVITDSLIVIGSLGIVVTGSIGLVMKDMKKVIAYSTGSQISYMLLSIGISAYSLSLFHLLNHGFFKALLFLSSGMVIHGLGDEQDIRRIGSLRKLMPVAYVGFVVGSVALVGIPFLSGYYSKDVIMEVVLMKGMNEGIVGIVGYILGMIGIVVTAMYSTRLVYLVFFGRISVGRKVIEGSDEGRKEMVVVVMILGFCSVVFGYLGSDMLIGVGTGFWLNSIRNEGLKEMIIESEFLEVKLRLMPVYFWMIGIVIVVMILVMNEGVVYRMKVRMKVVYRFLMMKWLFDKVYNEVIVQEGLRISDRISFRIIDKGILEVFGSEGLRRKFLNVLGRKQVSIETGDVYNYMLVIVVVTLIGIVTK